MRPLSRELITQYDINIKKYQYIRSIYYLETNKGKFLLRTIDLSKEQLSFIYEVDTHLSMRQFHQINAIYPTRKKIPYAVVGEQSFLLQSYIPCDETDFKEEMDLIGIITTLAGFHKCAVGIGSKIRDANEVKIRNVYEHYVKRRFENYKLKKSIVALKQKSSFELMFLEDCDAYRELEELALGSIDSNTVERIIALTKTNKCIAHKDFTYHTVNKSETGEYIISNIDLCNYDLQVIDLAQILSKIMQKNEWNEGLLYSLVEAYHSIRPLSKEEFQVLKFMLIYPEKYNSICYKYIASKRRWNYSMFEQKWANMLSYRDSQMKIAKNIGKW